MNKLYGKTCYLIGPMDIAIDGGEGWRKSITPWLENYGITVISPCDKPIDIGVEDEKARADMIFLKETGQFDEIRTKYKKIRTVDLHFCDICNFAICCMNYMTCGSWEEIFWCNRLKKPVLIAWENGKKNAPNWLFLTFPHRFIFSSLEEIKEYLIGINNGVEDDRWYHLHLEKITWASIFQKTRLKD